MNTRIEINDPNDVIAEAEALATNTTSIDSVRESLEFILQELNEYWSQTGEAAQSYYTGLSTNVEKLTKIVECNKEFAQAITNYSESQHSTSQEVIKLV